MGWTFHPSQTNLLLAVWNFARTEAHGQLYQWQCSKAALLTLAQQSMGVLLKCRFWFSQSGVRPEILHFQQMPRFLDHNLSSKDLCMCAKWIQSCSTLCNPMNCRLPCSYYPWHSPGKNIGVGCHSLLQGIILIQGSNLHLLCLCTVGRFFTTEPLGKTSKHL